VRRRGLRVGLEGLPDRLPVCQLVVEAAGLEIGDEVTDELLDRLVVEDALEELALEAPRHGAPVPPHGLQPHEVQRLSARARDQSGVALLAARRASPDLRHPEPRVDLLELELEPAPDAELLPKRLGDVGADDLAEALGPPGGPGGIGLARIDEERVRVPVDDAVTGLPDGGRREPDHVLSGDGDRVGDVGREEPAGGGPEHAEQRVHEDLRGLGADRVAVLARPGSLLPEARDQLGQDARLVGAEGSAARRPHDRAVGPLARRHDVSQRIDVEGADEARVQALEVEHQDVPVEPRYGVEDEAPRDDRPLRILDVDRRRDAAATAELGEVERVHRGDLGADPVDLHPGEEAAAHRQLHESRALEDLDDEPRVVEVVRGEPRGVVPPGGLDLLAPTLGVEELAAAEDGLRRGVEPVVVELDEGAAEEREPVQHLPAGQDDARIAREAEVAPDLRFLLRPPEGETRVGAPRDPLEDRDVEVADVPAGQDVRVGRAEMVQEALETRPLVGDQDAGGAVGKTGQRPRRAATDQPDPVAAVAGRRDRVEGSPVQARLDVERQDPEPRHEVGRRQARVPVDATHAGAALEGAVDREGAADPLVDQEAVREAHVGLEALDARLGEPRPERRDVAGQADLDPEHGLRREREERGLGHARRRSHLSDRVPVRRADEEVGREAVVHDQRRLAVFEDRVEMHLRPAVDDAVARGEQERSGQTWTSRQLSAGRSPPSARRRPGRGDRSRQGAPSGPVPGRPPTGSD
jgi:hypothetical protein